MNRLGKILTLGLEKKRTWQLLIIAGFRGPRTGSSSVAKGASPLVLVDHILPPRSGWSRNHTARKAGVRPWGLS